MSPYSVLRRAVADVDDGWNSPLNSTVLNVAQSRPSHLVASDASRSAKGRALIIRRCFSSCAKGDALVVTRVDRLARSVKDLQDIVHELKAKGVTLRATEQPIDTSTPAGMAFPDMLGVFAEFETVIRVNANLKDCKGEEGRRLQRSQA